MPRFNLRRRLPNVDIVEEEKVEDRRVESNPDFEKSFDELSHLDRQVDPQPS